MAASHDWLERTQDVGLELDHLIALCNEQRFLHWLAVAKMLRAHALAAHGEAAAGLALARSAFAEYTAMGFAWGQTTLLAILAHCSERAGQAEEALELLNTALAVSASTGERYFAAELHRLKAEWLTVHRPEAVEEAVAAFRLALAVARAQRARMWELRAATSLARQAADADTRVEARHILGGVYRWFTEGLKTPDLQAAKAALDSLG
jgi:predicted ATPase